MTTTAAMTWTPAERGEDDSGDGDGDDDSGSGHGAGGLKSGV